MENCYEIFKKEIDRLNFLYVKANTKSKKKRLAYDLIFFEDMYALLSLEQNVKFPWSEDPIFNEVRAKTAQGLVDNVLKQQKFLIELFSNTFKIFLDNGFSIHKDYGKTYHRISESTMQKYLVSFYNKFESGLGDRILEKLDNSEIIINDKMKNYAGLFFPMESIGRNFICFTTDEYISVEEARILAHELGHDFEFYNASKVGDTNTWYNIVQTIYSEASSCFFEYAFINHLIDNHLFIEDAQLLRRRYLNQIFYFMSYLLIIFKQETLNIDFDFCITLDREEVVNYANSLLETMNSEDPLYTVGSKISFRNSFLYGMCKILGVYIYDSYKESPKEFLSNFKTALLDYKNNGLQAFEILGITEESLLKGDVLKKTLKDCRYQ